ncbi:(4Fe-4S)-binding protein, partial [bacterium]|nr:(4Fe-4S)-binding protein [bacterium]
TPFGLHDLSLSVSVMRDMGVPFGVIVNRMEPGHDSIRQYCKDQSIPLLMEIPFSMEVARACADGLGILDVLPEFEVPFLDMFQQVRGMIS